MSHLLSSFHADEIVFAVHGLRLAASKWGLEHVTLETGATMLYFAGL